MIKDIQEKIMQLKKEKNAVIAAHSYQNEEILEIADYKGDSYALSVNAAKTTADTIILCGVHFMAETVKLLCPEKKVILANPFAGCTMAQQISPEYVRDYKRKYKDAVVVCYINTTAAVKAECDVCVTSSSALKIVEKLDSDNILFVPDQNLGGYVAEQLGKNMNLYDGCCPIHEAVTLEDTLLAKMLHPKALLLVHPECRKDVVDVADYVGSTSGIMDYAMNSDADEFIIGTEISIANTLAFKLPHKKIHMLSKKLICPNMRITNLMDVYKSLTGEGGKEIVLNPAVAEGARRCIDKMIELGG